MRDDLIPEVSYGTHFFQDLVESDTYYIGIFPEKKDIIFNLSIAEKYPNIVGEIIPDEKQYHHVISVYDVSRSIRLAADINNQSLVCFVNQA
jgi:hypothetical protein